MLRFQALSVGVRKHSIRRIHPFTSFPRLIPMKQLIPLGFASAACLLILAVTLNTEKLGENLQLDATDAAASVEPASFNAEGVVVLKFGATWCPPCRMIDKELKRLDKAGLPIEIKKIDVDENPGMARKFWVSSIPRVFLLQNGRELDDKTGFQSAEELEKWIRDEVDTTAEPEPPAIKTNPFLESE